MHISYDVDTVGDVILTPFQLFKHQVNGLDLFHRGKGLLKALRIAVGVLTVHHPFTERDSVLAGRASVHLSALGVKRRGLSSRTFKVLTGVFIVLKYRLGVGGEV